MGEHGDSWLSHVGDNRGSDSNVGFIWDESSNHFAAVNTTEEGTTSGDVTISSYADIKANKILLGSSELTENIVSSLSGITLGTVAASKVVTTDSNSQIDVVKAGELYLGSGNSST